MRAANNYFESKMYRRTSALLVVILTLSVSKAELIFEANFDDGTIPSELGFFNTEESTMFSPDEVASVFEQQL